MNARRISQREFLSRVEVHSGLPASVVRQAYSSLFEELVDAVRGGEVVVLPGFGRFYRQHHKGHQVRFGSHRIEDYAVLKFSASRNLNRHLDQALDLSDDEPVRLAATG